jgi:hypothetical protein
MRRTEPTPEIVLKLVDENEPERNVAAGHDSQLERLVRHIEAGRRAATRHRRAAAVTRRQPYAHD